MVQQFEDPNSNSVSLAYSAPVVDDLHSYESRSVKSHLRDVIVSSVRLAKAELNFFKIRLREDSIEVAKKGAFLGVAAILGFFSWIGLAAWLVSLLAPHTGLPWAIFIVTGVHLLGAGIFIFLASRLKLFRHLSVPRTEASELIPLLKSESDRAEGLLTVGSMKRSQEELEDARRSLSLAVRERASARRNIARNPGKSVVAAVLIGAAFGWITIRKSSGD